MTCKRILALVLCLCLMITVLPFQASAIEEEIIASGLIGDPSLEWKITADGTLTVSGAGSIWSQDAPFPWTDYADLVTKIVLKDGVKEIGERVFQGMSLVREVDLGNALTGVAMEAFLDCASLEAVHFPASISGIGSKAFLGCDRLEEISFDPQLEILNIWPEAFSGTPVKELTLPAGVREVDEKVFYGCTQLTTLNIMEGVQIIGENAFGGCASLAGHLYLPSSIFKLEAGNFDQGTPWTSIELRTGAIDNCDFANNPSLKSVVIGADFYMPDNMFQNCTNLESVVFALGLQHVGRNAFEGCTALKKVELPEGLKSFKENAFANTDLVSVTIPETVETVGSGVFADCLNLSQIRFLGNAPEFDAAKDSFQNVTATVYYEADRAGWTEEVMQDYGGNITWEVYSHEHNYTSVVTPPDCENAGYTTHTCQGCGHGYTDTPVDALGHNYNEWTVIKEANCTEPGTQSRTCTVCQKDFVEEIPAVGHQHVDNKCSICGAAIAVDTPEILSCYSKLQTSVKVTWTLEEGADGYELWRSATPEDADSWARVKTVNDGSQDRYTNQSLEKGVTYYYSVRAFVQDSNGEKIYSDFSDIAYMPAAVVWDGPYSNATFRIRLRWNEIGGAHGYQLWRLNEKGEWQIVKTLGDKNNVLTNNQGETTAYSNTGLASGENYTYRMRAFMITEDKQKVFGAYSDEFTVAVMPEAPVVTTVSPKEGRVQLSWEPINGAAGYQIWMQENGSWSIVKSVADGSTTYTKTGLSAGTQYQFKVRAYTEVDGKKTFGDYSEVISSTAAGPIVIVSGKCGDNLTWKLDDTGTLTISGSGKMDSFDGNPAPWAEMDPTRVVIESGVTSIGDYAFALGKNGLKNLREFSLPKTLKEIGYGAFIDSKLEHITIPDSVTKIDSCAFADSDLASIILPKGIKEISESLFARCHYLTEITIPEGVTKLGMDAFSGCLHLANITLPESLTTIASDTFSNCDALEVLILPDSVTSLDYGVFEDCDSLQSVYLSENIKVIPTKAFYGCSDLVEIILPAHLTTVKDNAFKGCNSLAAVYFPGVEAQLEKIEIYEGNDPLLNAALYLVTIITEHPEDVTVKAGEKVTFHAATSRDDATYQWYCLAPDSDEWVKCTQTGNKTDTLTFTATKDLNGYYFLCEITDPYGNSGDTNAALLTVK